MSQNIKDFIRSDEIDHVMKFCNDRDAMNFAMVIRYKPKKYLIKSIIDYKHIKNILPSNIRVVNITTTDPDVNVNYPISRLNIVIDRDIYRGSIYMNNWNVNADLISINANIDSLPLDCDFDLWEYYDSIPNTYISHQIYVGKFPKCKTLILNSHTIEDEEMPDTIERIIFGNYVGGIENVKFSKNLKFLMMRYIFPGLKIPISIEDFIFSPNFIDEVIDLRYLTNLKRVIIKDRENYRPIRYIYLPHGVEEVSIYCDYVNILIPSSTKILKLLKVKYGTEIPANITFDHLSQLEEYYCLGGVNYVPDVCKVLSCDSFIDCPLPNGLKKLIFMNEDNHKVRDIHIPDSVEFIMTNVPFTNWPKNLKEADLINWSDTWIKPNCEKCNLNNYIPDDFDLSDNEYDYDNYF